MRSLLDYQRIYREIASGLNLQGESVDLLVQLLANASYIDEVQNITYARESNFETATQMNSKIAHCMSQMYSVFRGTCPRVIMRFSADRVQDFKLFDEIVTSNNFKIYYLGYYNGKWAESEIKNESLAVEEGFVYSPLSISVQDVIEERKFIIIGLLAKEIVDKEWTVTKSNTIYMNCSDYDGLSNDMYVTMDNSKYMPVTRHFSDHVENGYLFDLTLPDFGSRIYIGNLLGEEEDIEAKDTINTKFSARYFKYSKLSEYNTTELKKIKLKGAELVDFYLEGDRIDWITARGYKDSDIIATGILLLDGKNKDSIVSTHYKANKERYLNSLIRSNNDLGNMLKELYPKKVKETSFEFNSTRSEFTIYYIPNDNNKLTEEEKSEFLESRRGYFVTDSIVIKEGRAYDAIFNIKLSLVNLNSGVDSQIKEILAEYDKEFKTDLEDAIPTIQSKITKLSSVAKVIDITITYLSGGREISSEYVTDLDRAYFNVSSVITTDNN